MWISIFHSLLALNATELLYILCGDMQAAAAGKKIRYFRYTHTLDYFATRKEAGIWEISNLLQYSCFIFVYVY